MRYGIISDIHGNIEALTESLKSLEKERIDACVFKTMTQDGPVSMCLHNARRDSFILKPVRLHTQTGERYWQPLSGALSAGAATNPAATPAPPGLKQARGRLRQTLAAIRET